MAQQTIKAIETVYNDYRFRSRLEARWAVFFDTLGVKYEYEKEGFDLSEAGWYLPDFWLPELNYWAEVKGQEPTANEVAKAAALCMQSNHLVIFLQDVPLPVAGLHEHQPTFATDRSIIFADDEWRASWSECFFCGQFFLTPDGVPSHEGLCMDRLLRTFLKQGCGYWHTAMLDLLFDPYRESPRGTVRTETGVQRLADAYAAARQARFEHGETPTVHKL